MIQTPVALLIFNRPETTQRVFEVVRQVQPSQLLIVADGPRPDRPGEAERCAKTRAIVHQVDWDCQVLTNFAETNLGCKQRVSSGLDWVFQTVAEAIILEDDCLPHPTFFRFCEELLAYYRHDERVMHISGDNFQFGQRQTPDSYYFSRFNHCWGWASWRRAWQHYDVTLRLWPQIQANGWLETILSGEGVRYWQKIFQAVYDNRINTWDYQWTLACWLHHGLSILPNQNLVSNIGFTGEATHVASSSPLSSLPTVAMEFPLRHPPVMVRHREADRFSQKHAFETSLLNRLRARLALLKRNPVRR